MEFHERLCYLMDNRGIRNSDLWRKTGKHPATISNYRTGKTLPDTTFYFELIKSIPDMNGHWLLFGTGEPFLPNNQKKVNKSTDSVTVSGTENAVTSNEAIQEKISVLEKQVNAIVTGFQEVKEMTKIDLGKNKVYSYSEVVTESKNYAA
ncbi:helix-turn-helix domain-containing protein [Chondrinema litorale]|uniref:helix-turn-helix domain-containing protein n=1 Tax=Chondrinema litorale TaxID=2994555 RepID=UPI0025439062|nr:helix-turn-helix transcriptional regulator [Chondrinema litorale]UZR95963.1 helix-turn-helix transcriptional regulator [Chondrinema litorale]